MTKNFNMPDGYNPTLIKPRRGGNHHHADNCDLQMAEQQTAQREPNEHDNDNTVQK